MRSVKNAYLVYVAPIPQIKSGIGQDVPAHVKVEWLDEQNRLHSFLLSLPEEEVVKISHLPDTYKDKL